MPTTFPAKPASTPLDDGEPSDPIHRESNSRDLSSASLSFPDGRDSAADSFEFVCAALDMCAAEDVFFGGKLLPLKLRPPPPWKLPSDRRGHPSLDGHFRAVGQPEKHPMLRRVESGADGKDAPPTAVATLRSKWCDLLVLGPRRVPAAMGIEEIRIRQRRRRSPPAAGAGAPWRLLRSLSCNVAESAAVTPAGVGSHRACGFESDRWWAWR